MARDALIDERIDLIKRRPNGAGTQHVVIIALRGMGKTTVMLMLPLAIREHRKHRVERCRPLLTTPIAELPPQAAQCLALLAALTLPPVTRCPVCGVGK